MFNKSSILLFGFSLILVSSFGQTIKVKKETARVKGEYADGYEVELQATPEEAEGALSKWMKTFGKTKQSENYFVVNEPAIQGRPYTHPIYAEVKQLGNIISVWAGIKTKDWDKDAETVNPQIEQLVREFGVNFHRDKIQKQIDESTRAASAVERQQQKLSNQNRDLNSRMDDNKREKIQLEKSLANNKIEFETLTKKLEKNKKDQDSIAIAAEQIRKVIDMHKERQRKVN